LSVVNLLTLIALLLLGAFAAVNWAAFSASTELSLLFGSVQAPLGVILLAITLAFAVIFVLYAASVRTSMLLESRRYAREVQAQRELADQAEASRFTERRGYLEGGFAELTAKIETAATAMTERNEAFERSVRSALTEATNTLSSYIGQMDDKLERSLIRSSTGTGSSSS
jgi:uncharacterized integral membrane protein